MEKRKCALDDCEVEFEPRIEIQKFCSANHSALSRVRRMRSKRRNGYRPPPPPAGPPDGSGLCATLGGAVEYGPSGSVSDKNRYSVKSDRKPPAPVPVETRSPLDAAA